MKKYVYMFPEGNGKMRELLGGNVWLTDSIPEPYTRVLFSPSELSIQIRRGGAHK